MLIVNHGRLSCYVTREVVTTTSKRCVYLAKVSKFGVMHCNRRTLRTRYSYGGFNYVTSLFFPIYNNNPTATIKLNHYTRTIFRTIKSLNQSFHSVEEQIEGMRIFKKKVELNDDSIRPIYIYIYMKEFETKGRK